MVINFRLCSSGKYLIFRSTTSIARSRVQISFLPDWRPMTIISRWLFEYDLLRLLFETWGLSHSCALIFCFSPFAGKRRIDTGICFDLSSPVLGSFITRLTVPAPTLTILAMTLFRLPIRSRNRIFSFSVLVNLRPLMKRSRGSHERAIMYRLR